MPHRLHLQFRLADPGWKHRATESVRPALEHESRRCKVIGEGVVNKIPCATAGRVQCPCSAPEIFGICLGLKNSAWRSKDPRKRLAMKIRIAPKRRRFGLRLGHFGFSRDRQLRDCGPISDGFGIHLLQEISVCGNACLGIAQLFT